MTQKVTATLFKSLLFWPLLQKSYLYPRVINTVPLGITSHPWDYSLLILCEIIPGCSLEGLMLKLKLQYFGHQMRRVDSLEKTLMLEGLGAGGEGGNRGWDGWVASLTRWVWVWVNSGSWWWTGRPGVLRFMGSQRVGHDWATGLNWTGSCVASWYQAVRELAMWMIRIKEMVTVL